jgi:hypothetical protein
MKAKCLLILCATAVVATGCASTTIYPAGKNTYTSVSTSSDQGYAEKDAEKKATEQCTKQGRRLVVLKHDTEYHGPDASQKLVGGIVGGVLGGGNPTTSSSDYQVKMTFKCE